LILHEEKKINSVWLDFPFGHGLLETMTKSCILRV